MYEFRHANATRNVFSDRVFKSDGCNGELFVKLTVVTTRNIRYWPSVMTVHHVIYN